MVSDSQTRERRGRCSSGLSRGAGCVREASPRCHELEYLSSYLLCGTGLVLWGDFDGVIISEVAMTRGDLHCVVIWFVELGG